MELHLKDVRPTLSHTKRPRRALGCGLLAAAIAPAGCGEDVAWPFYWNDTDVDVAQDVPPSEDATSASEVGSDTSELEVRPDAADVAPDRPDPDTQLPDSDGDGIPDGSDPAPDDPGRCGDEDLDQCDDCTVLRVFAPENDGFDADGDGLCELQLDPLCLHGTHAGDDPLRRAACELHALVNDDRRFWEEEGGNAQPLQWDEQIWLAALGHSRDMCERDFFEHDNPDGLSAGDRMRAGGVSMSGWGENISLYPTPLTIEYAFMAEPTCTGHRSNILAPGFSRGASALYTCDNSSSEWFGYPFTTQNFVTDRGLAPSAYCSDPATACEDVPDPVSTSRQWCPAEGSRCQDVEGPAQWDCPED